MTERNYFFDVTIKIAVSIPANEKVDAIKALKEQFKEDHNFSLVDSEIVDDGYENIESEE